ncbi:MAG: methyltransferase domain-containing protein [Caldilineaceae bacterium]
MNTLAELDRALAVKYGSYASYVTDTDPVLKTYNDGPADEVDRLLDRFAKPDVTLLDLGSGAGQTLCRLASKVKAIWGFNEEEDLHKAAQLRVANLGIRNATIVLGNVVKAEDIAQLPDNTFDVVLSRRGPDVNAELCKKLKSDAYIIQELYQQPLALHELFGRKPFLPTVGDNPHWLVNQYLWLGFAPVSVKEYFFNGYFRDVEHLISHLHKEFQFIDWRMPPLHFDEEKDRTALDLYVRYNTTPKGIRLLCHRKVYLFRRTEFSYFPAAPELKPLYV